MVSLYHQIKEAREANPLLTVNDGICACYEIEERHG